MRSYFEIIYNMSDMNLMGDEIYMFGGVVWEKKFRWSPVPFNPSPWGDESDEKQYGDDHKMILFSHSA